MKKTLLLGFLAIGLLTIGCSEKSANKSASSSDSTASSDVQYNGQIAFIRMDSLMNSYGMFIDMNDSFSKKQAKAQEDLTNKGRSLEREMYDYQDKAQKGLITRYQASTIEEGLQKKQQDITIYRDRILNQLAEEQATLSGHMSQVILDYLKEYNADKKYSLILQTIGGNPVIIGDPSLDITNEVLKELNRRYQDTLAKKTK